MMVRAVAKTAGAKVIVVPLAPPPFTAAMASRNRQVFAFPGAQFATLAVLYFASGFLGLAYEVTFSKYLSGIPIRASQPTISTPLQTSRNMRPTRKITTNSLQSTYVPH